MKTNTGANRGSDSRRWYQSWRTWLLLLVGAATAGIGLVYAALALYYQVTLTGVDRLHGVDSLVQDSAILGAFLVAIAALIGCSWFALRRRLPAIGGIVGAIGLFAFVPYLLISPLFGFEKDNGYIADLGGLFFTTLILSWFAAVGLSIAGLVGLVGMTRAGKQASTHLPRTTPLHA